MTRRDLVGRVEIMQHATSPAGFVYRVCVSVRRTTVYRSQFGIFADIDGKGKLKQTLEKISLAEMYSEIEEHRARVMSEPTTKWSIFYTLDGAPTTYEDFIVSITRRKLEEDDRKRKINSATKEQKQKIAKEEKRAEREELLRLRGQVKRKNTLIDEEDDLDDDNDDLDDHIEIKPPVASTILEEQKKKLEALQKKIAAKTGGSSAISMESILETLRGTVTKKAVEKVVGAEPGNEKGE